MTPPPAVSAEDRAKAEKVVADWEGQMGGDRIGGRWDSASRLALRSLIAAALAEERLRARDTGDNR